MSDADFLGLDFAARETLIETHDGDCEHCQARQRRRHRACIALWCELDADEQAARLDSTAAKTGSPSR